jgi:hypothetical protein
MLALVPQAGCFGDEDLDGTNGRAALAYFTHGDTSFANYPASQVLIPQENLPLEYHVKYYGTGFEILPAIAEQFFGMPHRYMYELRHTLCVLFSILMMFFCGLIGKELRNWQTAVLSLIVIAFTPTIIGYSFWNSKDIPVAAGFAMGIYAFIRIFKGLPCLKIRDLLIAAAGIAIALSVRISSMMLVFYFAVGALLTFCCRKTLRQTLLGNIPLFLKIIAVLCVVAIAGAMIGLCAYPNFFYEGPVGHIKNGLSVLSKFPVCIRFIWKGTLIDACHLPPFYLLQAYFYTIPLFVFGGGALFLANIKRITQTSTPFIVIFLLFTIVFPITYLMANNSPLYNGWRHTIFVYVSFVPLAALGLYHTGRWFADKGVCGKIWRLAFYAAMAAAILPAAQWLHGNYKYAYAYYNRFAGEVRGKFEIDNLGISASVAFRWLLQNRLQDTTRQYTILIKNPAIKGYSLTKNYRNIKFIQGGVRGYAAADCDYAILSADFIPGNVLRAFFPYAPNKGAIHVEKAGKNPICVVMEKNPNDAEGIRLVQQNMFAHGLQKLEQAYNAFPNNFGLWYWMATAFYYTGDYDKR